MAKKDHIGNRRKRGQLPKRKPDLGYYLIITDTEETEGNYIEGLKNTLPEEFRGRLVIKVINDIKTNDLINECLAKAASLSQYCRPWIMFDRDEVPNFDKIILDAEKAKISTAWSNPCLETWFEAYFRDMTYCDTSEICWKKFPRLFKEKTGKDYKKSNKEIYNLLNSCGDEEEAVKRACKKHQEQERMESNPSAMNPCSTVYLLIDEIQKKIKNCRY